jgi:hypothetical protein
MRPRPQAWLAVALASGCAGYGYRLDAPRSVADLDLSPYAMQEECVALDRGEGLDFYFVSLTPIAFNLYYHQANAVISPIVREHATADSGVFIADHKDLYCLRWEAGVQGSILEYRLRALPPR